MLLSINSLPENFDYYAGIGYEAIDLNFCRTIYDIKKDGFNHDATLDGDGYVKNLDIIKAKAEKQNIKISSTHLPYKFDYSDTAHADYEYKFQMSCRALEASEYVGAKWAVLHLHSDGAKKTVEFIKKLYESADVKNIGIAIENMANIPVESVIEACQNLKSEGYNAGICLDTGHCNIGTDKDFDISDVVSRMGSDIKVLHVHDNCKNGDFHREPFSGTINWQGFMKSLRKVGFSGDFNYEFSSSRLPAQIAKEYDSYCMSLGRYLISLYEEEN